MTRVRIKQHIDFPEDPKLREKQLLRIYNHVLEDKKGYYGQARVCVLRVLKEDVNDHYRESVRVGEKLLEYAKRTGDGLRVAKKLWGGRGNWGEWMRENFAGSPEKARAYIRVSKHWDDDEFVELRRKGIVIASIREFERIRLAKKKKKEDKEKRRKLILQR